MLKISLKEKIRYKFDNLMSKGTLSLIGFLAVISLAFLIIFSLIVWVINLLPGKSFFEILWMSLLSTLDANTLGENNNTTLYFLLMSVIALASIFIISILIGLLTSGIENKIWSLRKGRSKVVEKNHTIILGWSEIVFTILENLIESNKNQKNSCVVIMADMDKVEMEDSINSRITNRFNTRIICRQGNPIDINDLKIVNIDNSKSIIIVENLDSKVIKIVLSIINNKKERKKPFNIVTVLNEQKNVPAAKIAGEGQVELILGKEFISIIIAQACRQPGLSYIYDELLDFYGDEIYIKKIKELKGKTYRESLFLFEDSSIIGIESNGFIQLNPNPDTVLKENDQIIAISEDDDSIILSKLNEQKIKQKAINTIKKIKKPIEKFLILGWNDKAPLVINELDNYVLKNSVITIASDLKDMEKIIKKCCSKKVRNLIIENLFGDISDRELLESLTNKNYNHIIILAYEDRDIQEADALTITALIHLRDIKEKNSLEFSLTSEMHDIKNQELAQIAKVNDFIVSEQLLSLMLTQISEDKLIKLVFKDLLDPKGSEIYLKKVIEYIDIKEPVNFYTITESSIRKKETAIGYKLSSYENDSTRNFGIKINPKKSDLINFTEKDFIITLAEK